MKRSRVRPSLRLIIRLQLLPAAGLLLSAVPAGDSDRQRRALGAQQQCGHCHFESGGARLNRELFAMKPA